MKEGETECKGEGNGENRDEPRGRGWKGGEDGRENGIGLDSGKVLRRI